MEEQDSPWLDIDVASLHRVGDPDQAAIVADPVRAGFLRPFLGRELAVTQAAIEASCSPNAMLYRVRRMLDVGLLRVVSTRQRPGRPIKIYQSCHDGYFVPMDVMRYDDLRHRVATQGRSLAEHLTDAYTAVLASSGHSGRVLARNRAGDVWASDLLPNANHRGQPSFLGDVTVWLTREDAESVRHLLNAALDRALAASRTDPSEGRAIREPYLLVAGVLPTRT